MSNEKQQTAVEWLYLQMKKYCDDSNVPNDLLEQAKEIEKEQIINAFEQGENNSVDYFNPENRIKESEQYYNETYGGNK